MSWTFSWDSTSITLPRPPTKTTTKIVSIKQTETWPGDYALVISLGKQPKVLTIEGRIAEQGKTIEDLIDDYISPLEGRVYKQVTIDADGSRYDGAWILTSLVWEERAGVTRGIWYKMEFVKGSEHWVY